MKMRPPIKRELAGLLCVLVSIVLTGCVSQETAARSPKGRLLQDAEAYVAGLKQQDELPGYTRAEHGRMIASAAWGGGGVSYPASVTVRAWKQGDDSTYCYELVQETPESPWQLVKAARLDKHDKEVPLLLPK